MTAPASSGNKRRYMRFASIKSAVLSVGKNHTVVAVRIIDMSSAGARLEMAEDTPAPETFELIIHPDDPMSRKAVKCQLRWQQNTELGVSFI